MKRKELVNGLYGCLLSNDEMLKYIDSMIASYIKEDTPDDKDVTFADMWEHVERAIASHAKEESTDDGFDKTMRDIEDNLTPDENENDNISSYKDVINDELFSGNISVKIHDGVLTLSALMVDGTFVEMHNDAINNDDFIKIINRRGIRVSVSITTAEYAMCIANPVTRMLVESLNNKFDKIVLINK